VAQHDGVDRLRCEGRGLPVPQAQRLHSLEQAAVEEHLTACRAHHGACGAEEGERCRWNVDRDSHGNPPIRCVLLTSLAGQEEGAPAATSARSDGPTSARRFMTFASEGSRQHIAGETKQ
jgi:hypothetical protein